jgi:hypothetical protein
MLKRFVLAITGLACLIFVTAVSAQVPATLVLRSGERVSGNLIDLNASGFVINVGGQERAVGRNDVAVVEFTPGQPTSDIRNKLNAGGQVVVMRDGQVIDGRLSDIGGTSPLRVTIDTSSGSRDVTSSEVARIYLANPGGPAAAPPVATTGEGNTRTVTVPGNQQWTATDIQVNAGDTVRFQVTGEVRLSPSPDDVVQAAGAAAPIGAQAPLPGGRRGVLLGRVDGGQPFEIGGRTSVRMPASGRLQLGINDDVTSDNGGEFRVVLTTSGGGGSIFRRRR